MYEPRVSTVAGWLVFLKQKSNQWTCVFCKTKSQVCARFAWICELQRDFSRIRLVMHTFENMSKSLIFSADVHKFVICGCYANLGRRKKVSNAICCTTTDYELLCIRTQDEWFWHVFEGMHHKTNSWKVPPQFANSRKTCANLRFCFAQKTQVHYESECTLGRAN